MIRGTLLIKDGKIVNSKGWNKSSCLFKLIKSL